MSRKEARIFLVGSNDYGQRLDVTKKPVGFRHQFAYWVIGYQGFIEPLVRAALASKLAASGYTPCKSTVCREDLEKAVGRMQSASPRTSLSAHDISAFAEEMKKRHRLQLDLAFVGQHGMVIGEVKSWGGFATFTDKLARDTFCQGRNAHFLLLPEIGGYPVERVIIVVWGSRSFDDAPLSKELSERYGVPVEIEYATELLREHCPSDDLDRQRKLLTETFADVEAWLDSFTSSPSESGQNTGTQ